MRWSSLSIVKPIVRHRFRSSVIIFKVNVESILAFECESHSPVATYRNTPGASAVTFQPVQAITWQIHVSCSTSTIEHVQLSAQTVGKVGGDAASLARFKEPFQTLV